MPLIAGPRKLRRVIGPSPAPSDEATSTMAALADITGVMGELMLKGWVRNVMILDFISA
ncbi:hypothetical protein H1R20_g5451, partial [Candolleomyces eurysporus]